MPFSAAPLKEAVFHLLIIWDFMPSTSLIVIGKLGLYSLLVSPFNAFSKSLKSLSALASMFFLESCSKVFKMLFAKSSVVFFFLASSFFSSGFFGSFLSFLSFTFLSGTFSASGCFTSFSLEALRSSGFGASAVLGTFLDSFSCSAILSELLTLTLVSSLTGTTSAIIA